MTLRRPFPTFTADEAAVTVFDGAAIAFSGFTPAGAPKALPQALADRARAAHDRGQPMAFRVLTSASTGASINDPLLEAGAISWRAPYQCHRALLRAVVERQLEFVDFNLSHLPGMVEAGFLGDIDFAIVEAVDVLRDGRVYLSTSVGATPSFLRRAKRVIVEVNQWQSSRLLEMHDIGILPKPPHHANLPIEEPLDRMGTPFVAIDPAKIVGVVETDAADQGTQFREPDETCQAIAGHLVAFLVNEMRAGRLPPGFLPLQAGVGNVINGVMSYLGRDRDLPQLTVYGDVIQDSLIDLLEIERLRGASGTSLNLGPDRMARVFDHMNFFGRRIVLRPQEFSNNPTLVRRLGVIAINSVVEMDIWGRSNCTHLFGRHARNAVGGSDDFTRNAYLSFLVAPSVSREGRISTVVPMVSHVDHSEHSVQILVTEQGVADLRGLGPQERARCIIENCAHPMYRDYLYRFLAKAPSSHIVGDARGCFELHNNLIETGAMLPASGR